MRLVRRMWVAALLVPALAVASSRDVQDRRTLKRSVPLQAAHDVRIDLRWGELEIEPAEGSELELTLSVDCRRDDDRCARRLADLDIVAEPRSGRMFVEVTGLSHWGHRGGGIRLLARVPRGHKLAVDMGAGEVMIEDFAADLEVDLGAGEIRVRMPEHSVRRVDLSAGVGDARLRGPDGEVEAERSHLLGGNVRWDDGPGSASVDCHVGAGDVEVRLD